MAIFPTAELQATSAVPSVWVLDKLERGGNRARFFTCRMSIVTTCVKLHKTPKPKFRDWGLIKGSCKELEEVPLPNWGGLRMGVASNVSEVLGIDLGTLVAGRLHGLVTCAATRGPALTGLLDLV